MASGQNGRMKVNHLLAPDLLDIGIWEVKESLFCPEWLKRWCSICWKREYLGDEEDFGERKSSVPFWTC